MREREIVIRLRLPETPRKRWLVAAGAVLILVGAVAYAATSWPSTTSVVSHQPILAADLNYYLTDLDTRVKHLTSGGATPTVTFGAGAGSGCPGGGCTASNLTVRGTDTAGTVRFTTGTSPGTVTNVFTVTFATAYTAAPTCVATTSDVYGAGYFDVGVQSGATTTTSFTVVVNSNAIPASASLGWSWICIQ